MNKARSASGALAAATTAFVCAAANAEVLLENLGQPTRAVTTIDVNLWAAQSFVTDATAHPLAEIDILAGSRVGSPLQLAGLYSDSAARPGTLLTTLSINVGPGSPTVVDLVPAVQVMLAPSTAYWLVIGASGVGSLGWAYAEGNGYTGTGSLGSYAYSSDLGVSWGSLGTDNPYQMSVQVVAVPEPETFALLLAGLSALGMIAKYRKPT